MNKVVGFIGGASLALLLAGAVQAGTMNIVAVDGNWTSLTGGTHTSGIGTESVRWGDKIGWDGKQSGYDFDGFAPTGPHAADVAFDMGKFTHVNMPIGSGSSITGATLEVMFTFNIDGGTNITRKSIFDFTHLETPNNGTKTKVGDKWKWICDDGGESGKGINSNGCADKVTATTNPDFSESFKIGKVKYVFQVAGFDIGDAFWTRENCKNTATLRGVFTQEEISEVPLPAGGLLLLGGLSGLGALARRRKAA